MRHRGHLVGKVKASRLHAVIAVEQQPLERANHPRRTQAGQMSAQPVIFKDN
jgi:hypothetical protein